MMQGRPASAGVLNASIPTATDAPQTSTSSIPRIFLMLMAFLRAAGDVVTAPPAEPDQTEPTQSTV